MSKIISMTSLATALAGAIATFLLLTPPVNASTVAPKGDRLDLTMSLAACKQQAWPYYETCSKDGGRAARLVTTNHLRQ